MLLGSRLRDQLRLMNENRNIASGRESHLDGVIAALCLVKRGQALPEPVRLDPGDRIFGGIENSFGASKNLGGDVVFRDLVQFAGKRRLANISERWCESRAR